MGSEMCIRDSFKAWTPVPKSIAATLTEDIRKRKGLSPNPPAATEFIDRD